MSTETETETDRREMVARAIYDAWNISGVPFDHPYVKGNVFREGKALAQADAVLAVLEPWLLPELPELPHWAWSLVVEDVNSPIVSATVEEWVDDDSSASRYLSGTGSTVPAAIRDALESGRR